MMSITTRAAAVDEIGDRSHNRHGPKRGGLLCPFRGGWELGPRLTQCGLAEVYFRTKSRLHPSSRFTTVDIARKWEAVLLLGEAATPSNTTSPRPSLRPYQVAS